MGKEYEHWHSSGKIAKFRLLFQNMDQNSDRIKLIWETLRLLQVFLGRCLKRLKINNTKK